MQNFLWVVVSIVAYVGGLVIVVRVTPRLLMHSFDEVFFMGGAVLDILGALLAFGAIVLTFIMFNGAFPIRVLNFLLLVGILAVTVRTALYCIRPRVGTTALSRALTGGYGFFLAVASVFYIVQIFTTK